MEAAEKLFEERLGEQEKTVSLELSAEREKLLRTQSELDSARHDVLKVRSCSGRL